MDINSTPGTIVTFIEDDVIQPQIMWGHHTDPRGVLEVGKKYTVSKTEVHGSYTKVFLVGYEGMSFNSVWFD